MRIGGISSKSLAVCIFGDYNPDYPRQVIIKRGLKENGVEIFECNCYIKHVNRNCNRFLYLFNAYRRLLKKFLVVRHRFSVFIVPHNNHLIVPLAWLLSRLYRKKLIMDAFDPAYRTALMKGLSSLQARIRYYLEWVGLKLSDYVLVATDEFKKLYVEDYGIKDGKIFVLPVGADQKKFHPQTPKGPQLDMFTIVYWGKFHPHHGVEVIVEAAKLLRKDSDIQFILVGSGPNREPIKKMAEEADLKNVKFTGFLPDEELIDLISRSDICLGIFSGHRLALCSITNKVFQALAMGKAVITERSRAIEQMFDHEKDLYMVEPENPEKLAQAITTIKQDPQLRKLLETNARSKCVNTFTEKKIGKKLLKVLEAL